MKLFKFVLTIIMLCSFATFGHAAAYMKLGDIKGEATDKEHKGWIIIESISSPEFKANAEIDASGQCGVALRQRGDTTLGDIVVVRELDKSSTKLNEAACITEPFRDAVIEIASIKRKGVESYLRYKLTDVIVTSYSISPGTNSSGELVPLETVVLTYGDIMLDYVEPRRIDR